MKKIYSTLVLIFCFCFVFSLTACTDSIDYSKDISALQKRIEDLENNTDLTKQITTLSTQILTYETLINSLTNSNTQLTEQLEGLITQLEELASDNTELVSQLDALSSLISESNESLSTTKSDLAAAQAKLTLLENQVYGESKTYSMGDTVTFANNGIKYLDFTFVDIYGFNPSQTNPIIYFDCNYHLNEIDNNTIFSFLSAYLFDVNTQRIHEVISTNIPYEGQNNYLFRFTANNNSYGAGDKLLLLYYGSSPMAIYKFNIT